MGMGLTETPPSVPVESFKRTKIIATLGPATDSYEQVYEVIKAGANGLRLNFSHGTHEQHAQYAKWVRKASKELGKPVALIQDLQGPKIRLGDFDGVINVQSGMRLAFKYNADYAKTGLIPIQYDLSKKVQRGEKIYLYDGKVHATVTSVQDGVVYARAENEGILIKRKSMNLPNTDFGGDIITAKDKADLAFGSTLDVDYVAQSFVQTADDLRAMRKLMKNHNMNAKLIVKFETRAAIDHMQEIVEEVDVVMVARGDLAVETPAESVPIVQRQLVELGLLHATPTIIATQMLLSMTEMPDPTRAEVSDVATAVLIGADCVMLSEETAAGKYPVDAVAVMKRVILYAEQHTPVRAVFPEHRDDRSRQAAISDGIIRLSETIQARAIVAETKSGATALQIATRRPEMPIIAVTSDARIAQQLTLVHGVKSYIRPVDKSAATKLTDWLKENKLFAKGDVIVTASGQHPGVVGTTDTIKVRVLE
jgi:pyruvate kinase